MYKKSRIKIKGQKKKEYFFCRFYPKYHERSVFFFPRRLLKKEFDPVWDYPINNLNSTHNSSPL